MKTERKIIVWCSAITGGFTITAAIIALLYWLTGLMGLPGARWWAVITTLALPVAIAITARLATHAAREHLAGFDRGLDGAERTIQSVGRGLSATASLARSARGVPQPVGRNDDLLPNLGTMRLIDAKTGDELIDL